MAVVIDILLRLMLAGGAIYATLETYKDFKGGD